MMRLFSSASVLALTDSVNLTRRPWYSALPSWAIQHEPSELERKLWEKRKVNIFDLRVDEFIDKLGEHARR